MAVPQLRGCNLPRVIEGGVRLHGQEFMSRVQYEFGRGRYGLRFRSLYRSAVRHIAPTGDCAQRRGGERRRHHAAYLQPHDGVSRRRRWKVRRGTA